MAVLAGAGVALAAAHWRAAEELPVEHSHVDLPADHPHLKDGARRHRHSPMVDALHAPAR